MLVLSRKFEQSVIITTPAGERISVKVLRMHGNEICLGFQADKSIVIHREEVEARIDLEERQERERRRRGVDYRDKA